ncbi:MAG: type II and III secretion system protein, partial [Candidatus Omnitrophica bacterium]|nr:type II and III secretion system protein [Candidatus Omnitrophota bacterium]
SDAVNTIVTQPFSKQHGTTVAQFGLQTLTGFVTPNIFNPKTTSITTSNTGVNFRFQKLTGFQFDVALQALEEDARANTLSAPQIMTLSGQEASIIVGTKYPILKTQVSGETTTTTTTTLDYYQDIGIQLYVVPQVSGNKYIDMIIHPVVSTFTTTVGTNAYPIIIAREAETQMVIEDGDTVVLGGLLKDVKANDRVGVPFLSKIPILGLAFSRATVDVEKIDLLIFITARIVRFDQITPEELAELKAKYETALPIQGSLRAEGKGSSAKAKKKKAKSKK